MYTMDLTFSFRVYVSHFSVNTLNKANIIIIEHLEQVTDVVSNVSRVRS